jgi:hypothetical protein
MFGLSFCYHCKSQSTYRAAYTHAFAMSSEDNGRMLNFSDIITIRTVHEATLQDFLNARNFAVLQLLRERNQLLEEQYCLARLWSSGSLSSYLLFIFANKGNSSVVPRSSTPNTSSSRRPTPTRRVLMVFFFSVPPESSPSGDLLSC